MLKSREYTPNHGDVLYHYCTAETLHAIVTNKTLRFSDLFSMNDYMELSWGHSLWEKMTDELVSEFGEKLIHDISLMLQGSRLHAHPLVTCFSKSRDVLSQWRAYAQDGTGYAIGFDAETLYSKLPARTLRVSYNEEEQRAEIRRLVSGVHHVEQGPDERDQMGFTLICTHLAFDLAAFKNPAFSEEDEVRLVHLAKIVHGEGWPTMTTTDLLDEHRRYAETGIKFHIRGNTPVPHIDMRFCLPEEIKGISQLIIGPKNASETLAVGTFMASHGFPNVEISRSVASYR